MSVTTVTTEQIEQADRYADEAYGDQIEDVEVNELGIVYTLLTGQMVVVALDGTVTERDASDPAGEPVAIGQIIGFAR